MQTEPRTIGDSVTLQRGTTYKSRLLGEAGPVLLGLASIARDGGFRSDNLKTYGGDSPDKLVLAPGDLFVSLKDVTQSGDLLGSVARLPPAVSEGRLTQDTVKLVPKKDSVPSDYLYWLLRTPQYRAYCRAHAMGTTNLSLSRRDFLSFPAPDPTPEQLRLTELLEDVEEQIELNRRMNRTLEALAQALFRRQFVAFDGHDRLADSGTDLGEIPEGWTVGRLADEFKLTMGQSPPGSTYNEDGEGLPFYQGATDFGFRFPSRRKFCTEPKRFADAGDTLISVRAPVGTMNMALERLCIGRGVAALRHKSGARSYTYWTADRLRQRFEVFNAEGTVFGSINKRDFSNLRVVVPPLGEVEAFEREVGSLDDRVEANVRQLRTLAALRDALLPELVSGRVRVPEGAVPAEAA